MTFKLESNENIILRARKHWFMLFAHSLFLLFLLVVPALLLLSAYVVDLSPFPTFEGTVKNALAFPNALMYLFLAASFAWVLMLWVIFFVIWTDYYLDVLILTNSRLIDIEQKGLFSREIATLRLGRIQDITVSVHGPIATVFNFGDIHVQTAGREKEFIVRGLARPYAIKSAVLEAQRGTH
jgi:uncharacterized membrane protein YdbT with pleckstrin-like domain